MQLRRLRLMIRVMLIPCMVAALVGCASHDTLYGSPTTGSGPEMH
ncbi:MAG: hypothetical protein PF483_12495 [Halothiobacillus sp.]|jgi:type IV pilus biogenesis protein CpaD/CtpE|nr:hypothetical protein [Halothiobacillus sp.]